MHIVLWVTQILLALHTVTGAVWKFTNGPETVPSLSVIPPVLWKGVSIFEILCALALVLPLLGSSLGRWAPIGALGIAAVMVIYCGLHFAAGHPFNGQIIYWTVVAAVCAFVAYGRWVWQPFA